MAFVMDPIEAVDIDGDTTFALMLEATERGAETLYVAPDDIGVRPGSGPIAVARTAQVRRRAGDFVSLGEAREVALDEVDVVWQRKDPPVDESYVRTTQMLSLCQRALVLNRPESVLASNEKLYALNFPDLMPSTRVARTIPDLEAFLAELDGEMIVKPLDGKGGEGIFHIRRGDPNVRTILETSTAFETRWVMAQAYVPEVRTGDKRILLVDGEPLGAVLRVPADGESRANFHSGGQAAKIGLDEGDRRIVDAVAPHLKAEGLFFVGIDVIGDRLTEINVTSPTGIQEMSRLDGVDYSAHVLDAVEAKLAER
jgi:glutathione synthase